MTRVKVGNVVLKCWDLGGQPRFRSMWERYCQGVNAIIFILDSADPHMFDTARAQLHAICQRESLYDIPVLVLGNKNDLPEAITTEEIIKTLDLTSITNHQVSCYSVSVKEASNLDSVLNWLISTKSHSNNVVNNK